MMEQVDTQAVTRRAGMQKACMDYLRERPNQKFYTEELAAAFGYPLKKVAHAMNTSATRLFSRLQREECGRSNGTTFYRFWIGDDAAQYSGPDAGLRKCMRRHKLAIRPSELAQLVKQDVHEVADALQRMHEAGDAVRCELPLHSGPDKFEYRLMGIVCGRF